MVDKTNILPDLQVRLGVDWTPAEKEAEKELGKIIYRDANIDLEALDENLNGSEDKLFENYMVKRNDFIYREKIGGQDGPSHKTSPLEILRNITEKIKKARKGGNGREKKDRNDPIYYRQSGPAGRRCIRWG